MKLIYRTLATFLAVLVIMALAVAFTGCDDGESISEAAVRYERTKALEVGPPVPQPRETQSPLEIAERVDPMLAEKAKEKLAEKMADQEPEQIETLPMPAQFVTKAEFQKEIEGVCSDIERVEQKIMEQHALIEAYVERRSERKIESYGYQKNGCEDY